MENQLRIAFVTRDTIQRLLSDDEIDRVSMAQTAERLALNDEFIDLTRLRLGVQKAQGLSTHMGHVLPRKSVREKTWRQILGALESFRRTARRFAH